MGRNSPDAAGHAGLRGSQQAGGWGVGAAHVGAAEAAGRDPLLSRDGALALQIFLPLAPLLMLGARIAWKTAEIYRELRHHGGAKTIDGVIATACNCFSA